jgi:hypothetical protein
MFDFDETSQTRFELGTTAVEALLLTAANVLFSSPAVHPSRDVNNLFESLADPTNTAQNRYVVDITLDVVNVILDIGTVRHLTSLSFFTTGYLDLGGLFPRNFRVYSGITGSGPWVLAGQSFRTEPTPTAPVETSVSAAVFTRYVKVEYETPHDPAADRLMVMGCLVYAEGEALSHVSVNANADVAFSGLEILLPTTGPPSLVRMYAGGPDPANSTFHAEANLDSLALGVQHLLEMPLIMLRYFKLEFVGRSGKYINVPNVRLRTKLVVPAGAARRSRPMSARVSR